MKAKYNENYIKLALSTPMRLEYTNHHLLPLQFFDESLTIKLPYNLHISLHKNFTNYQLIQDPVGCIIKCIENRKPIPKTEVTLGDLLSKQGIRFKQSYGGISEEKLFKMIENGFAHNIFLSHGSRNDPGV